MSQQARIEELSDSSDSDPPEADVSDFLPTDILRTAASSQASRPSHKSTDPPLQPTFSPPRGSADRPATASSLTPTQKRFHCLYPLYFDASRSRTEGRRVGKSLAVANPLARTIVDAAASLGYEVVFEPGKMHPKDWGNPGRVRVGGLHGGARTRKAAAAKNKHHLYIHISEYLQSHPTTALSPLSMRVAGMPMPEKAPPPPAVPKGWKINKVVPLHSPALSGGGVSENIIGEMMEEMKALGGPGGGNSGGMEGMEGMMGMMGAGGAGVGGGGGGGSRGGGGGGKKGKKG